MTALWLLMACGTPAPVAPEPAPAVAPSSDVERAAAVARAIAADPSHADQALEAQGLSEAEYRALLYAIARDPAKSQAFEQARH